MIWYDRFNLLEAGLWVVVALAILFRARPETRSQRWGVAVAGVAFVVFGATDLLEIGCAGFVSLWLWGLKIACGATILAARYAYRGWRTWRWTDREFLFGVAMLVAVGAVILVQRVSSMDGDSGLGYDLQCHPLRSSHSHSAAA